MLPRRRAIGRSVAILACALMVVVASSTHAAAWYTSHSTSWQAFEAWVMPTYLSGAASLDVYTHGDVSNPSAICKGLDGVNRYHSYVGPQAYILGSNWGGNWQYTYAGNSPGDTVDSYLASDRVLDTSNNGWITMEYVLNWPDGVIVGRSANVNFTWQLLYNPGSGCTWETWQTSTSVTS